MPANPRAGDAYRQEYYAGSAEDQARVLDTGPSVRLPDVSAASTIVTREWSSLEPEVVEKKYYVANVGDVEEAMIAGGEEHSRLVSVRH